MYCCETYRNALWECMRECVGKRRNACKAIDTEFDTVARCCVCVRAIVRPASMFDSYKLQRANSEHRSLLIRNNTADTKAIYKWF